MLIKSFKLNKKLVVILILCILLLSSIIIFSSVEATRATNAEIVEEKKDFIKWVDFNVTANVLNLTAKLDIESHNKESEITYNWI